MVRFNPQAQTFAKTQASKLTSTDSTKKTGEVQITEGNNNTLQPQGFYINKTNHAVEVTYKFKDSRNGEWHTITETVEAYGMINLGDGAEVVSVK